MPKRDHGRTMESGQRLADREPWKVGNGSLTDPPSQRPEPARGSKRVRLEPPLSPRRRSPRLHKQARCAPRLAPRPRRTRLPLVEPPRTPLTHIPRLPPGCGSFRQRGLGRRARHRCVLLARTGSHLSQTPPSPRRPQTPTSSETPPHTNFIPLPPDDPSPLGCLHCSSSVPRSPVA